MSSRNAQNGGSMTGRPTDRDLIHLVKAAALAERKLRAEYRRRCEQEHPPELQPTDEFESWTEGEQLRYALAPFLPADGDYDSLPFPTLGADQFTDDEWDSIWASVGMRTSP